MLKAYVRFQNWMAKDEGATAVEYGLMVALIAVVIIGGVTLLGGNISALFVKAAGSIK
ncbi:MAG TPA: Flp family type IVb pilin [Coriobacteriia bacterium]